MSAIASSSAQAAPPSKIVIPDLVSHCTFELRVNRHRKIASAQSKRWLFRGDNLTGKKRDAYHGLKAGLLTSMCYPNAGAPQLRVCCDFMNYLFHLDNLSDDMDNRGTKSTADVVLNALYNPKMRQTKRVGKMTKEYVFTLIVGRQSRTHFYSKLLAATYSHRCSGCPAALHRDFRLLR